MVLFRWLERSGPHLRLGSVPLFPSPSWLSFFSLPYTLGSYNTASHMHVMGLTGMGKSKLLANIAAQIMLQGYPCAVIDPHGDLADDVLSLLIERGFYQRPNAMKQVLYVNFADPNRFIPFNVLRQPYSTYDIARNLVEACMRAWPSLAGGAAPQFENLLLAGSTVLIENKLPLTALTRLLIDQPFREQLLQQVHDPQVLDFFRNRYDGPHGSGGGHLNESTLRRAFLLTYPPPLRYSLGQSENALDFRSLMDCRTSLICSLGGLDPQTQRLLGCLLTVGFETAALSRADIPPQRRSHYHLIIDEFSQFSAQSGVALERVLAQARKYGLYLTLAHQTWSQVDAHLQGALQNTTFISFRLGNEDVAWGAQRVAPFNPYQVKYWTQATASHPAHPVMLSRAEQQAQWEYALLHLRRREAVLRVRGRTIQFRTASVRGCGPKLERRLKELQEQYAQQLLRPREDASHTQAFGQTTVPTATKKSSRFEALNEDLEPIEDSE